MNKKEIGELIIEEIEIKNVNLLDAVTFQPIKEIKVYAHDIEYNYEIELNEEYKIKSIPALLNIKYDLKNVQTKINKFLNRGDSNE